MRLVINYFICNSQGRKAKRKKKTQSGIKNELDKNR